MKALSTRNLTKKYGRKIVVNDLSLDIEKGTIFGFLGENGAGKSTFINMITGLSKATSGSFEILGHDEGSLHEIQHKIGVLPDYSTFYENYTALEHLKYFRNIFRLSLTSEELKDILKNVGLEDAINVKTKNFSFGMKKKLGLAQALINKPELLFLDEPTSGVDANSILGIHSLIRQVASQGTTIFLTSHNLDEVEKLCNEIAIMSNGTIQTKGNMQQLRSQYQKNLSVYIKHQALTEDIQSNLQTELRLLVRKMNISTTHSEFFIEDETVIPEINNYLVSKNIKIYRLEVEEPSLEEIFLNLNTNRYST